MNSLQIFVKKGREKRIEFITSIEFREVLVVFSAPAGLLEED